MKLFFKYVSISIRGQMQYKASFIMMALGQLLVTGGEILGIWALFHRFNGLLGWRLEEVAFGYGLVNISFALAEALGRGFDIFPGLVRIGVFDRLLLRPLSTVFQVAARDVQVMRVGRFSQGLIVLAWSIAMLHLVLTPAKLVLMLFAIIGGVCLFSGLFILQATLSFWTIDALEIMNILTYGGTEAGEYPLPIYSRWFQRIFIFIVPLAGVVYFPSLVILGKPDTILHSPAWVHWLAPVFPVCFLMITLRIWELGVRHYRSVGS